MPISLISTPFARFQIRLTLAVHPNLILEPCHTRFCREISFVAIYTLLDVPFSAIHGDEWLFHDYDASAGLPTLAQVCQVVNASAGFIMLAQGF